ncbi:MAG: HEPN domain-containing protein [Candidatus Tectomicrobia bacterium]|nr:HEPN domain-containing protein [Candidatus Tectomicrobia bacterium]
MNNLDEVQRRLIDAKDCFVRAERDFSFQDYRGTIQNAQLAIDLSAKAVISYFNEPEWTHNLFKLSV